MSAAIALIEAFLQTLWRARTLRTRDDIAAYQRGKLRRLIADATRTTDFYAPFAGAAWDDLPIVDKATQQARFGAFNTCRLDSATAWQVISDRSSLPGFEVGASTGTSGPRGLYLVSETERFRWLGTMLAKLLPEALFVRHRVAIVLPGPSPLYQSANQSRLLRLAHFDARRGLAAIGPEIEAFAPTVLLAAPKTLRGLAKAGAGVRPRKIFAAAEVLDPSDAAIAARGFKTGPAQVFPGQVYMATEGLLGTSCRLGHVHLAEDVVAFELAPIAGDPTLATALMTDFTRRTQIMARYRLGDLLRLADRPCPCGSPFRRVAVVGRESDLIRVPSRSGAKTVALPPDVLRDAVLEPAMGLDDYRIGLDPDGRTLRLLLPPTTDAARAEAARDALQAAALVRKADVDVAVETSPLKAPFDRKLRRIAPVPAHSL